MKNIFKKINGIVLVFFCSMVFRTSAADIEQHFKDSILAAKVSFPHKIDKQIAIKCLENKDFFEASSAFIIVYLLNKFAYPSSDEEYKEARMHHLNHLLMSKKLQFAADLKRILDMLFFYEKNYLIERLKDEELGTYQKLIIASFLPFEESNALLQKNIFWRMHSCFGSQREVLFSKNFLSYNSGSIITFLSRLLSDEDKTNHFQKMMPAIAQFAKEEYRKDRLVFFHGQHDQWAFLCDIFDALIFIKNDQTVSEKFIRLRFKEHSIIQSDDEILALRERAKATASATTKDRTTEDRAIKDRAIKDRILFTTLHLLENDAGANPLAYIYNNFDQISRQGLFNPAQAINELFLELDMLPEYEQLIKQKPTLCADLYDQYKKDVIARGNTGRLVAISMPKELAKKLTYFANGGGFFKYEDTEECDVVKRVAEGYFYNEETCVILGKEMTDPCEAQKSQVAMVSFTTDENETSLPLAHAFKETKAAFLAQIASLHLQRKKTEHL